MSIHVVLPIILCNMTRWRACKVLATLFAIGLGATQFTIGILVAVYRSSRCCSRSTPRSC